MKEIHFLKNGYVWATVRTLAAFRHLFSKGFWNFTINGKEYSVDDWRGRKMAENLFK
jgi:hypothetical protein